MKYERITLREAAAALIGAALMSSVTCLGQWLDAEDRAKEEKALRESAARVGLEEGLARLRCIVGLRYDAMTGLYVDVAKKGLR